MKLLTPKQVCEILICSDSKLRGLPIRYIEVGGQRRYPETALQDYLVDNTVLPEELKQCQLPKGKTRHIGGYPYDNLEELNKLKKIEKVTAENSVIKLPDKLNWVTIMGFLMPYINKQNEIIDRLNEGL